MDKTIFYTNYPNFDWKFYVSIYTDLQNAGINTEKKSINHYWEHGNKEGRRTHEVINKKELYPIDINNIIKMVDQYYISDSLETFKDRFKNKFSNLHTYNNNTKPCLFFGVYNDNDLHQINQHKGLMLIMPGGSDVNPNNLHSLTSIKELKNIHNIIYLSISKCIYERLQNLQITSIYIYFNMLDYTLFKYVSKNELGNSVFIFNGQTKGRCHIYGKKNYEEVMKRLPNFNYIFSNTLNIKYEKMPSVYKKCFIMLRLTENDGNANSVQECEAMNIPVIHNQSDYGLKWRNVDDIVQHIKNVSTV